MYELKTRPTETDIRERVNEVFTSALYRELSHSEIIGLILERVYIPLADPRVRGRQRLHNYARGLVEGHMWHLWRGVCWATKNPSSDVLQIASYDAHKVPDSVPYEWTKEFDSACINWPSAHIWPKSGREFTKWEVQK